ncbi:unnamed protein product, partial [marine sediment metagenome]
PTPVPTFEEEREPTSKAIRDAESLRLRNAKGHRGNIVTNPLGASSTTGIAQLLGGTRKT